MPTKFPNNLDALLAYEDKIRRSFGRMIQQYGFQFARIDWRANMLFNKTCVLLLESMREEFMLSWIDTQAPVWRRLTITPLLQERSAQSNSNGSPIPTPASESGDQEEAEFRLCEHYLLHFGQDILSGDRAWLNHCQDKPWNLHPENQRKFEEAMRNPLP